MRAISFAIVVLLLSTAIVGIDHPPAFGRTGSVMRQFRVPIVGNGRGIAFDGNLIYYTRTLDTNIYITDTRGALVSILPTNPPIRLGALSWDDARQQLWGGSYDGTRRVVNINPRTGAVTVRFLSPLTFGDSCYSQPSGFIDGLEFDNTSATIWLSDDAGKTIYRIGTSGNILYSINVYPSCNTGLASDGRHLWMALYGLPNPDFSFRSGSLARSDFGGVPDESISGGQLLNEDLAFDDETFSPRCALWAMSNGLPAGTQGTVTAFEVPCAATFVTPPIPPQGRALLGAVLALIRLGDPNSLTFFLEGLLSFFRDYATLTRLVDFINSWYTDYLQFKNATDAAFNQRIISGQQREALNALNQLEQLLEAVSAVPIVSIHFAFINGFMDALRDRNSVFLCAGARQRILQIIAQNEGFGDFDPVREKLLNWADRAIAYWDLYIRPMCSP